MPDTIESFVKRLQSEGVEEGRQAAEKIEAEAKERAAQILREAEIQASEIRSQAEADATLHRNRVEAELRLAVRDIRLVLRETLSSMLQRIFANRVEAQMSDDAFLRDLIQEVLRQYARADSEGRNGIRVNLTAEMEHRLAHWAVHQLRQVIDTNERYVELHGTLEKAGFEYRISSGTVEVTAESVAAKLHELARPGLRKLLSESGESTSAGGNDETSPAQGGSR